jgi:hypothetical protein
MPGFASCIGLKMVMLFSSLPNPLTFHDITLIWQGWEETGGPNIMTLLSYDIYLFEPYQKTQPSHNRHHACFQDKRGIILVVPCPCKGPKYCNAARVVLFFL